MKSGRTKTRLAGLCLLALIGSLAIDRLSTALWAAPTAEQAQKIRAAAALVSKAETLYKSNRLPEAVSAFAKAQAAVVDLAAAPELAAQVDPLKRRLVDLHDQLELDGAKVPALDAAVQNVSAAPVAPAKTPPAKAPPADKPPPAKTPPAKTPPKPNAKISPADVAAAAPGGNISFVHQLAPLLVQKCGKCHVSSNKGMFSMATYTAMMRGVKGATVVSAGKGKDSRIVEVIESGDMPRGGGSVSAAELAMLVRWIDQGAKFDGRNPAQSLATMSPNSPLKGDPIEKLDVAFATAKDTIHFARDIAPVLADHCLECHGTQQSSGGLQLSDIKALLKGGNSGLAVMPGKPDESLLIKKLKGTAGERMPFKRAALPAETIAKFEKWIAEGAHFDGGDPAESTEKIADAYRFAHLSAEQKATERGAQAKRLWHLAVPTDPGLVKETKNFFIIGDASAAAMDQVAVVAEQMALSVGRMYKAPDDKLLLEGRIVLFVCRDRNDYTEFGRMVEERQIPASGRGHLRYDGVTAYGCILPPAGDEYSLPALIGQQVGGLYIASLGSSPRWFYEGVGSAIGLRINARDPRLRQWEDAIPRVVAQTPKPEMFLKHGLTQEENDVLSLGFAKSLMRRTGEFQELLGAIRQKREFAVAFQRIFGAPPEAAAKAWLQKE